jgi:hypothetical protein
MASTGLLTGVNPYRSGNVAVDFSSKPLQYAVQEIQHQKAKAEATDKYFMDWEKSINPAGLAQGELNKFTEKLRAAKEYGIKNKEQINNPSRYGYDAQSTLEAMFKDAQNYVELGKQATASRKAFKSYLDSARKSGKHIKGDFEALDNAMKTVGDGYVEPDSSMVEVFDPHNEKTFETNITTGIKPAIIENEEKIIDPLTKLDTGTSKKIKNAILNDEEAKKLGENSLTEYKTKKGTTELFDTLYNDKNEVKKLNDRFGEVYKYTDQTTGKEIKPEITSIEDFARAYGIKKIPKSQLISESAPQLNDQGKYNEWYKRHVITSRDNRSANSQFAKDLAAKMGQNILESTLEDMRSYDDKGNREIFADNPKAGKLNASQDILKPYIKKENVYLGIANKITKKKPTPIDLIPTIAEEGDKIFIAYPILDDEGKESGKYDWKHKINVTNQFKSKIVGATESTPRVAAIVGAALKAPNKL